jgi:hypothetical protein
LIQHRRTEKRSGNVVAWFRSMALWVEEGGRRQNPVFDRDEQQFIGRRLFCAHLLCEQTDPINEPFSGFAPTEPTKTRGSGVSKI